MKQSNPATQIWKILYPLLFYYAVDLITLSLAQLLIGSDDSHYVICQLIASIITIFFMLPFYRQDQALRGMPRLRIRSREESKGFLDHGLWAVVIVLFISIAANNLISMTPLVNSQAYQTANAGFYGSTMVLELLSSAIATPLLEELTFRGITFGRLMDMLPKIPAILVSALLFAVMHFNIVQLIYAFLLGIVLAILMEKAGHVYPSVIGHMTANAVAVIRTETGWLSHTVDGSVFAWVVSVLLLAVGIAALVLFCKSCSTVLHFTL